MFGTIARTSILFMVLCGLIYPLAVTGIAKVTLPKQAEGSLIYDDKGDLVGSELIGQNFTGNQYFHSRISSIEYDASSSGTNNYAPTNIDMLDRMKASIESWELENPEVPVNEIPMDLITNSGSGLDPHITPESAKAQISRIVQNTDLNERKLENLIDAHTNGKEWGLFGEKRVNVLLLNIELSKQLK